MSDEPTRIPRKRPQKHAMNSSAEQQWFERPDAFRRGNYGPGLFISPNAKESARRAFRAAMTAFPTSEKMRFAQAKSILKQLEYIANTYWANRKFDQRPTLGEGKDYVRALKGHADTLLKHIKKLPPGVTEALNDKWIWDDHRREYRDYVSEARALLEGLQRTVDGILEDNYKKGSAVAAKAICSDLWKLREQLTGSVFVRNFTSARGKTRDEFVSPDARFVQIIVNAIDPEVSFQTIRSQLQAFAKRKPSRASTL